MSEYTFTTDPEIKNFESAENPSFDQMVKAYTLRDKYMNLDSHERRVFYLEKLGYTIEKANNHTKREQKKFVLDFVSSMYDNTDLRDEMFSLNSIISKFESSEEGKKMSESVEHRLTRFNELTKYLDSSNEEFYKHCTYDELTNLGW